MNRVNGKVAIVTGGTSGIGWATAKRLAAEGATVVITSIEDGSHLVSGESSIEFISQDVSKEADWQRVIELVQSRYGAIDILINNAGIAIFASIENTTLEQWDSIQQVNSTGTFLGCKYGLLAMKEKGGVILNISSIGALKGMPGYGAYCASKGAIRALTKTVAAEVKSMVEPNNTIIRCNSIHPGPINTPMAIQALADAGVSIEDVPGTLGEPEDVAAMVLFLASDEAKHVSGAELSVDGGACAI